MENYDVIIVGAGVAGLSCALELSLKNKKVLILEAHEYVGGRTSSFYENGMHIESGFHRFIGYYEALPSLLKKSGTDINNIVTWEDKIDILIKNHNKKIVLGMAPIHGPIKTIRGVLENNDSLSLLDKASLLPFTICGLIDYFLRPKMLDSYSVEEYAKRFHVTDTALKTVLEAFTAGIFFLPPNLVSAYVFFGLFVPAIPRFHKMRIGAYLGGMTDVMCEPIANKIKSLGGEFIFNETVETILFEEQRTIGVRTASGKEFRANDVVVATPLPAAKKILQSLSNLEDFKDFFRLPTMSAVTFQIELDQPSLEKDITTFGPLTSLASFAEQSRTTFRKSPGRLSIILREPELFVDKSGEEILEIVLRDAEALGIHIREHVIDYRKVNHRHDFHTLEKGHQHLRPDQKTSIKGLTLAGDYTKTPYFATMEGAVVSGKTAANVILS